MILVLGILFISRSIFAEEVSGYSFMELSVLFSGVSLGELEKLSIDMSKMDETSMDYRKTFYAMNKQDSAVVYSVANCFLPGIGSALQRDYKTAGTTLAVNAIGWTAFYVAYGLLIVNGYGNAEFDADINLDVHYGVMFSSAAILGVWNLIQMFRPLSYEKTYNKELKRKLQVRN